MLIAGGQSARLGATWLGLVRPPLPSSLQVTQQTCSPCPAIFWLMETLGAPSCHGHTDTSESGPVVHGPGASERQQAPMEHSCPAAWRTAPILGHFSLPDCWLSQGLLHPPSHPRSRNAGPIPGQAGALSEVPHPAVPYGKSLLTTRGWLKLLLL